MRSMEEADGLRSDLLEGDSGVEIAVAILCCDPVGRRAWVRVKSRYDERHQRPQDAVDR